MIGKQARQGERQQEYADEEDEQDDDQAGTVGQATEDPVAGPTDLRQLDTAADRGDGEGSMTSVISGARWWCTVTRGTGVWVWGW